MRFQLGWLFMVFFATGVYAGGDTMAFSLKSSTFENGKSIPEESTCDGVGQSPPLAWSDAPVGTKTFALIADDPDAPGRTWVHWVLFNIPANTHTLRPGVAGDKQLSDGSKQGENDFQKIGYGGPCPPGGTHRYFFKLYALDAALPLHGGATKAQLESAMKGHILAQAQLMGTYQRR